MGNKRFLSFRTTDDDGKVTFEGLLKSKETRCFLRSNFLTNKRSLFSFHYSCSLWKRTLMSQDSFLLGKLISAFLDKLVCYTVGSFKVIEFAGKRGLVPISLLMAPLSLEDKQVQKSNLEQESLSSNDWGKICNSTAFVIFWSLYRIQGKLFTLLVNKDLES